jgi:hypothetical protein
LVFPAALVEQVAEEFAEALDLAKFSGFPRARESPGVGDPEFLKEGFPCEGGLFGVDAVVLEGRGGEEGGPLGADGDVARALALEEKIACGGEEMGTSPIASEGVGEELGALFGRVVLGGFPGGETMHQTEATPFFEFDWAGLEVSGAFLRMLRLAEGEFDKGGGLPGGAEVMEELGGGKHEKDVG